MSVELDIQRASTATDLPTDSQFLRWAEVALEGRKENAELTVRVVDNDESRQLNASYRGKDKPTNVLSFPFETPPEVELNLLGDLVICAPVVAAEARQQQKSTGDHWAHMVIHGILHLLGHDHIEEDEAQEMESLEIQLLAKLGIANPYEGES